MGEPIWSSKLKRYRVDFDWCSIKHNEVMIVEGYNKRDALKKIKSIYFNIVVHSAKLIA